VDKSYNASAQETCWHDGSFPGLYRHGSTLWKRLRNEGVLMLQVTEKMKRVAVRDLRGVGISPSRRSYSTHSKLVNNAFFIVFDQYEKAFEELAKV
jgi:hypothetical protein